uniref:Uncharacterized protein n=1 Tax=Rhipicephalus appendiculatus TaxID=34631 RepID=A0A131YFQ6_RHIAP
MRQPCASCRPANRGIAFFFFSLMMLRTQICRFVLGGGRHKARNTKDYMWRGLSKRCLYHLSHDVVNFNSVCITLVSSLSIESDCVVTESKRRLDLTKYGGFCTNATQTQRVTT